jgi:hypothetical protein
VQFVVAVYGSDIGTEFPIYEIRFPLAGVDRDPLTLSNAKFLFLSREKRPGLGRWTYFGYPLRQAFESRWGKAPTRWDKLEVFLEVRYDAKTQAQGETSADVYFDDIYAGPQAENPNRP